MTNVSPHFPGEVDRRDLEQAKGRPFTQRSCVFGSVEVIRIQNARFFPSEGVGCALEELSAEGGSINGRLKCTGLPAPGGRTDMTADLSGSYTTTDLNRTGNVSMTVGGCTGNVEGRVIGHRIGGCQKGTNPLAEGPYTPHNTYNTATANTANTVTPSYENTSDAISNATDNSSYMSNSSMGSGSMGGAMNYSGGNAASGSYNSSSNNYRPSTSNKM